MIFFSLLFPLKAIAISLSTLLGLPIQKRTILGAFAEPLSLWARHSRMYVGYFSQRF